MGSDAVGDDPVGSDAVGDGTVGSDAVGAGAARGRGEACGKVILLGEHSVVYGRPALAAGLPQGAHAQAQSASGSEELRLHVMPWDIFVSPSGEEPLRKALAAMLTHAALPVTGISIEAMVNLPSGAGLGSSAALAAAVLRAIDSLVGVERSQDDAHDATLAWERVFHGNPSGVDNAMALAGGVATFVRGEALLRVAPSAPVHLVIGDTGMPCSTKSTVEEVARQHARHPERTEKSFDAIAAIVRNGRIAVETGDHRALGQLFDMNQHLLAGLMVSTSELEGLCRVARDSGALGAKLTGGGGGGCMIALASDEESAAKIASALSAESGRPAISTRFGHG